MQERLIEVDVQVKVEQSVTQVVCGTCANLALTQATQVSDSTQLGGKGGGVQLDEEVIQVFFSDRH